MFDGKAFGLEMVGIVKAHIERVVAPLNSRIADLEKQLAEIPTPKDGKDADVEEVTIQVIRRPEFQGFADEIKAIKAALQESDGSKSALINALRADLQSQGFWQEKAEGLSDYFKTAIGEQVAMAVAALPPAEKGKDADPAETEEMVVKHVERVLAGWERPKNGLDGKDGAPGADGKDGAPGINGKDGADAIDAMIDRDGNLVLTLSDGRMKNVGLVVGKDGEAGRDGIKGADGADGVGFDDMSCEIRDDGVYLVWEKGELVKEARIPIPMDRGIYKQGQTYRAGDGVTWGGSFWIAQEETAEKPDTGKGWRLAVKKGRDGKDAADPKKGK